MSTFRTDAPIKSSLNAGLISGGVSRGAGAGSGSAGAGAGAGPGAGRGGGSEGSEETSEQYLDDFEEELNKRVDGSIGELVSGLESLLELAKVGTKDRFKAAQDGVESELKAEQMVRATENLLSLSHTLKLFFLLNNEDEGTANVERAQREHAATELSALKQQAEKALKELMATQM